MYLFSSFLLAFLLQLPSVIAFHFLVLFNVSHFSFFLLSWLFCFSLFCLLHILSLFQLVPLRAVLAPTDMFSFLSGDFPSS